MSSCQRSSLIGSFIQKFFFTIALLLALVCGLIWPQPAVGLAQHRSLLLFVVMFMVGLEQHLPALAAQFRKVGAISLSLILSFIVFPILSWAVAQLFFNFGVGAPLAAPVIAGFVVLGAVPTTLTSAVIYTRLDKGNDRLALIIVLLSQFLCVLVTPALVSLFLAKTTELNLAQMIIQLCLYFLLPLALGMLCGRFLPLEKLKPYLMRPEQLIVALFVFMGAGHIPRETALSVVAKCFLAVILLQLGYVVLIRLVIKKFNSNDQTALFFTSSQKTLSVGLYLLLSYFPSAAILPMVLYHLLQLTIGRLYWVPPDRVGGR